MPLVLKQVQNDGHSFFAPYSLFYLSLSEILNIEQNVETEL